jgi:hypothetical protein
MTKEKNSSKVHNRKKRARDINRPETEELTKGAKEIELY